MRRASIYEQYDVETGESASRTGDYGTGGANRRLGKARKAERTGTSGTGETSETSGTSGSASRTGNCETSGTSGTSGTGGILCKKTLLKSYSEYSYSF